MSSTVFGVKIVLQDKLSPVTQNTGIGLYNVASDNSEIRLVQNAISGVSTWKEGVMAKNGLKSFSNEIDLTKGGAIAYPGKGAIVIDDTAGTWKALVDAGFKFDGLIAEVHVFYGVTPVRLRTYCCKEPSFDGANMTVQFEGAKRTANILNVVTSAQFPYATSDTMGKVIPAVFGKHIQPKIKCTLIENTVIDSEFTMAKFNPSNAPLSIKAYPVTGGQTPAGYINDPDDRSQTIVTDIKVNGVVSNSFPTGHTVHTIANSSTCIRIIEGNCGGQVRKLINYQTYQGDPIAEENVRFCTENYFDGLLSMVNTTRSWLSVERLEQQYGIDNWPIKGYLDELGNDTANTSEIYLYNGDEELVLQQNAAIINSTKNLFALNKSNYSSDYKNIKSFNTLPASSIELYNASDMSNFAITTGESIAQFSYAGGALGGGMYRRTTDPYVLSVDTGSAVENLSNCVDKNKDSFGCITINVLGSSGDPIPYLKVIKVIPPTLPDNFSFDKCYIGLKLYSKSDYASAIDVGGSSFQIRWRRFRYNINTILGDIIANETTAGGGMHVDDIPEKYFASGGLQGDKAFYYESSGGEPNFRHITGYQRFELTDITNADTYNAIAELILLFKRMYPGSGSAISDSTLLYEACFIFEKDSSITELYTNASGRIFNSTFDGRKTASDMISKPQDLFEHLCRLQDYRDKYPTPASGWGLQYASGALIHTASFDQISDSREPATQIFDLDDGYTDKAKQTIAREMAFANWQDADGRERILALPTYRLNPVHTVTLDDVMDRSKIKIVDTSRDSIYSEPFVRYQKNPATGDHERLISVKNASATTYMPAYIDGVENALEAEDLWRTCHSLALKSHRVNKPPTDMTDLQWANGPGGYTIALRHIQNWARWQALQEIELPVHFNLAASWQECTPINVLFSHQTGNVSRSALVERTEVNPAHPYDVLIRAVIYA